MEDGEDLAAIAHYLLETLGPASPSIMRARVNAHLDAGELEGAALWARVAKIIMASQEHSSATPDKNDLTCRSPESCNIAPAPTATILETRIPHIEEYRGHSNAYEETLLRVEEEFLEIDRNLDQIVASGNDASNKTMLGLHQQWQGACSRAAILPAYTDRGLYAKANILLAVLAVVAPSTEKREPYEMLAESLARDVLRRRLPR